MYMKLLWGIVRSLRPLQWLKNLVLLAALFLSGNFFEVNHLSAALGAVVAFCLASSSMYVLNDVVDRKRDQLHPTKKHRAIASGVVPVWLAIILIVVLGGSACWFAYSVHKSLEVMVLGYMALQLSYSLLFKRVIIIDAMLIALGFVLRVYAGAFVIAEPMSAWLLLAVASGAWFLALGKRRSELTLMGHRVAAEHRQTLLHYPEVLLDSLTTMAATSTLVFYSLYTFLSDKHGLGYLAQFLPSTLEAPKLMMLTLPLVLYGVARYLYLIYEKKEADSPEVALVHDWPLLLDVVGLAILLWLIIYVIPEGGWLA
jgi:hypothetical protein